MRCDSGTPLISRIIYKLFTGMDNGKIDTSAFVSLLFKTKTMKNTTQKRGNYGLPVDEMELPTRLKIILKNNGINTLKELAYYLPEELLQLNRFGFKSVSIIEKALDRYGLRMGDFIR